MNYLSKNGSKFAVWHFDLAQNGNITERLQWLVTWLPTARSSFIPAAKKKKKEKKPLRIASSILTNNFRQTSPNVSLSALTDSVVHFKKTLFLLVHSSRSTWPTYHRQQTNSHQTNNSVRVGGRVTFSFSVICVLKKPEAANFNFVCEILPPKD